MKLFKLIRSGYYFSSLAIRSMTLGLEIMFVLIFVPRLTNVDPILKINEKYLWPLVGLYVAGIYFGDLIYFKCIRHMIQDLKLRTLKHMGSLSLHDLNNLDKPKVAHYLEQETNIIAKGTIRTQDLLIDSFLILTHILLVSNLSLNYILITTGITAFIILTGFLIRPILKRGLISLSRQSGITSNQLIENINAVERIQHENMWSNRIDDLKQDLDKKFKLEVLTHTIRLRLTVVFYFVAIFYIIMITNYVEDQGLSVLGLSALTIFIRLSPRLLNVQKYLSSWHVAQNLHSEMENYLKKLNLSNTSGDPERLIKIDFKNFNIHFNDKTFFAHPLNLTIEGPGFFGIIGESGSGKSLIADCLAGFKRPSQGEILFNLKKQYEKYDIYLISSLTPIYPLTLIDNIKLQSPYDTHKFDKIIEQCDLSELKQKIGLGILNSNELSLGERQRIIMARAMYYAPSCIILDESLSSLDFLKEQRMLNFLKEHSLRNIVIHISHQLDSVRDAKKIFLLQDGHLIEGTWSQLAQSPNSLLSKYEQRQK